MLDIDPIVYGSGQLPYPRGGPGHEWSWSAVTWRPVTGPTM
jgi:hypothetical protein